MIKKNATRGTCINKPDVFCYTCGEYTIKQNRKPINDVVKNAYMKYFGMQIGDQDKVWAHILPAKPARSTYDNGLRGMEINSNFMYP